MSPPTNMGQSQHDNPEPGQPGPQSLGEQKLQVPAELLSAPQFLPRESDTPSDFSPGQWRKLRFEHERFAAATATKLSYCLRLDVGVQLSELELASVADLTSRMPTPGVVTSFKVDASPGTGLVGFGSAMALAMVDRLTGGAGQLSAQHTELTEIEIAVLDHVTLVLLTEWCLQFRAARTLQATILGHDSVASYLLGGTEDAYLVAQLAIGLNGSRDLVSIAVPVAWFQNCTEKSGSSAALSDDPPRQTQGSSSLQWNAQLESVMVPVKASWPAQRLSAREIVHFKVGDVLEWKAEEAAQIAIHVGGVPKFLGRLGTRNGHWSVEISSPIHRSQIPES